MPEIDLEVGDRHEIRLRGLGGAGYSWAFTVSGDAGVVRVRPKAARVARSDARPEGRPPPSTSLPQLFEITALAAGTATLAFELRRPWEGEVKPIERLEYEVVVREP